LNQKFKFQWPKNNSLFLFLISFPFWPVSILSPIFMTHLILSSIFFSPTQLAVRLNRAFDPPTQFHLVIFDLQTPVVTFGRRIALHCIVRLQHCGATSPPSLFPSENDKRHVESSPIIHRTHSGSNLSSSRPEPSFHQSTTGHLF
jgi:hypothetical protein